MGDAGFVLEPDLYRRARREERPRPLPVRAAFEGLQRMLVLGMMARPDSAFHEAQLLQLTADRGLLEQDGKRVIKPLDQIDQPPAHQPV